MNATAPSPLDSRLALHGGRLGDARALHPNAPEPWIDLSTGINPKPYPAPRASAAARARLPEPQQLRELEASAARAFGVDESDRVAAVAGSEAALRLIPHVLGPTREACIAGPTYSSHADAWQRVGVRPLNLTAPAATPSNVNEIATGTVFTLVNPNNPDGHVTERERVLALHDELAARDGFLAVDEAFADVEPACSVAAEAGSARYPRLIVFRSFGKFFGLAGLRLGFVIAAPSTAARFRGLLGDWPVTADTIAAGLAAYADKSWAERTRARLRSAARRLDALLTRNGFILVGGTSLFRLARSDGARSRFEQLLHAGILVRPFDHDPTLLRFGLPRGSAAWRRLTTALRSPT